MNERYDRSLPDAIDLWAAHVAVDAVDIERSNARHLDPRRQQLEDSLWRLAFSPGDCVLDCGSGTGFFSSRVRGAVGEDIRLVGLDISNRALAIGKKRYPWLTSLLGDGHALPFGDQVFDGVVSVAALEVMADYQRGLDEIDRVLKPGARLYLMLHRRSIDPLLLPNMINAITKVARTLRPTKPVHSDHEQQTRRSDRKRLDAAIERALRQRGFERVARRRLMVEFNWAFYQRFTSQRFRRTLIRLARWLNRLPIPVIKDLEGQVWLKRPAS